MSDEINENIYRLAMLTPKITTSMRIHVGTKEWCERNNVIMSNLLDYGFKHLLNIKHDNQRLIELEDTVKRMEKNIIKYQALLLEYRSQEIKKGGDTNGKSDTS